MNSVSPTACVMYWCTWEKTPMAYVIAEPCIGTKDTACVDAGSIFGSNTRFSDYVCHWRFFPGTPIHNTGGGGNTIHGDFSQSRSVRRQTGNPRRLPYRQGPQGRVAACSKLIFRRVPVAAARRSRVCVDGRVRPLSRRAIADWVVSIRL